MIASFLSCVRFKHRHNRIAERSAALAFHFLLAVVPLLGLLVILGSIILDGNRLEEAILHYIEGTLGGRAALPFTDIFHQIDTARKNFALPVFGLLILGFAMGQLFALLRNSLFSIFNVPKADPGRSVMHAIETWIYSFLFGLSLVLLTVSQFALSVAAQSIATYLHLADNPIVADILWGVFSFALVWMFFTFAYRLSSAGIVKTRSALAGGLVASTLYVAATMLLAFVFSYANTSVLYGTIAPVVAFILWTYYVAHILLSGAVVASCAQGDTLSMPMVERARDTAVHVIKNVAERIPGRE